MNAGHDTVVIADSDIKFSSPYVFNKIATSRGPTQKLGTRVSTVKTEYSSTDTARCALGWHVHCTVLRARELFVLRMRTLAIQYPDPWGKSAIPNKENSPPCPGWGEVGANIDRYVHNIDEGLIYPAIVALASVLRGVVSFRGLAVELAVSTCNAKLH